jgi:DNA helicase-2/ATP-dependent DNA helicase PcrA
VTSSELKQANDKLTDIQREAVAYAGGALLVLAGPGSGKTQVLTCRIAKLLDESRDKNFRILALTFTNKAADEMVERVRAFVPGLEERANIGTFHSFCAQVLRQHGVHLGIKPDFAIYSLESDRKAVLEAAISRGAGGGASVSADDAKLLVLIDKLKSRLVAPDAAAAVLKGYSDPERIAHVYQLYEDELRAVNALDFNSLIFEAHRLLIAFPAIAARYRRSHPYWLIDEFQDTNHAQYSFVKALAGEEFKNVFAVADDDQIIYQWNGASYRHIQRFTADFSAKLIQLPTNYRCPPAIVDAANHLVVYNAQRTSEKKPLIAGKTQHRLPTEEHIRILEFETEEDEAKGVAAEILKKGRGTWGQMAVLARTRAMLDRAHGELVAAGVPAAIAQRRDDFLSPEFRWLVALLKQTVRPLDKRNMTSLIDSFNRATGLTLSSDQIMVDAEASGEGYLSRWYMAATDGGADASAPLLKLAEPILGNPSSFRPVIDASLVEFGSRAAEVDLAEDISAWREISREIATTVGRNLPLDQFLQELQLRSKEPTPKADTVRLMTIHSSKGREFDFVFLLGLAEDVLPSFQSIQKGDKSPEMEEERRNCFVAITRTKECLVLSRANRYRGYRKKPSRFLEEMGFSTS